MTKPVEGAPEASERAGGPGARWVSEEKEPRVLFLSGSSKGGALITIFPHPRPLEPGGAACPQNTVGGEGQLHGGRHVGVVEGATSKQPPPGPEGFCPHRCPPGMESREQGKIWAQRGTKDAPPEHQAGPAHPHLCTGGRGAQRPP
ncbi:hypothetical protein GH733_013802 [Mirounga leonina]|nr:hypothetical protein GH733_013802 [Mirounga leonina]